MRLEEKSWDKQLRKFSKGMLQRVGLAQALVNDPEVVFLDEPMSGLDPVGRREVRDLIAVSARRRGTTVFFCSHILSDIEVLCDRAAVLRAGGSRTSAVSTSCAGQAANVRWRSSSPCADADASRSRARRHLGGARLTTTPGGARVEVSSERTLTPCSAPRAIAGARLVAVQPVGNPLEELFVGEK